MLARACVLISSIVYPFGATYGSLCFFVKVYYSQACRTHLPGTVEVRMGQLLATLEVWAVQLPGTLEVWRSQLPETLEVWRKFLGDLMCSAPRNVGSLNGAISHVCKVSAIICIPTP